MGAGRIKIRGITYDNCRVCKFICRVRKDGMIEKHRARNRKGKLLSIHCVGSDRPPVEDETP